MSGASVRTSIPAEASNDSGNPQLRSPAPADSGNAGRVGGLRLAVLGAKVHSADAQRYLHRSLSRHRDRALFQSFWRYVARDAAWLRARIDTRLFARYRGRAQPADRIFPLSFHCHVPVDAEGGARAADHRLVRTRPHVEDRERRAGRVLPADGQYHRRPALGRGGPRQPDALARGHPRPDLLDAAAAQCAALHLRRARDRHDLRPDRRHRRRIDRLRVRSRHADHEHELHHGRRRPVLGAVDSGHARPAAEQPRHRSAAPRAVLGSIAEARHHDAEQGRSAVRMKFAIVAAIIAASVGSAEAQTTVRVGWCARTISSAAAPYAIATKLGWFADAGLKVDVVPLPGSTDCVKAVATGQLGYALPSIEPVAIIRPQGVRIKNFYTAYQGNIYGIVVPADSTVQKFTDLKGKSIGVISMASAGVIIARALAANNGMDPDRDIKIVVAGEAAQTAALLRSGDVQALSQFDTQYALTENAGAKLRFLDKDNAAIARFPSNGFIALEDTLARDRAQAVALTQNYAKGTIFAMTNPEAAIRILWEVFPQTKATGKDEATALHDDLKTLEARARNWRLEAGGVTRWGENSEANYGSYVDFLLKNGVLKEKVAVTDLITNALIDDINKFDANAIKVTAQGYRAN